MKLTVAWIGKTKTVAIQQLTGEYLERLQHYAEADGIALRNEAALLQMGGRSRTKPVIVLLDAKGKQFSSEEFAQFLGDHQDRNPAPLIFAVGPASGFSKEMQASASVRLSLGKMTIAHELARVVLLEQLYRAFTILRGHPYHLGH